MPRNHKNSDSSDAEDFDNSEFKKMLGKMFPSKHMKKEIENMDKIDKKIGNKKSKKTKQQQSLKLLCALIVVLICLPLHDWAWINACVFVRICTTTATRQPTELLLVRSLL
jgi:tRNA G10  N-methylase Trm11